VYFELYTEVPALPGSVVKLDVALQAEAMNLGAFTVLVDNLQVDQAALATRYSKDSLDFKLHVKALSKVSCSGCIAVVCRV
jgi:hypothetical protein